MTTYTVALQDGRDLPTRERIDAEVRFASELERVLGGEECGGRDLQGLDGRQRVRGQPDRQQHGYQRRSLARWRLNAARQAGFSKLGDIGEAHFEVRLERHAA